MINPGWQCPVCNAGVAPHMDVCPRCPSQLGDVPSPHPFPGPAYPITNPLPGPAYPDPDPDFFEWSPTSSPPPIPPIYQTKAPNTPPYEVHGDILPPEIDHWLDRHKD